jgi:hypothetical protein
MKVYELASKVLEERELATRADGSNYIKFSGPIYDEWFQDLCREAHNDELPNDWIFNQIDDCLNALVESEVETDDQFYERLGRAGRILQLLIRMGG